MKVILWRTVFSATLFLFLPINASLVQAQRTNLETFAITNARVITVSGAPVERGTVVIRNGLIAAIGANVKPPADARVIDGAGLTVYPGFFDADSNLGISAQQRTAALGAAQPQPALTTQPALQQQNFSNSTYPAGLRAEISAAELIRPNDVSFETARSQGFTTVLSVPRERILIGQSALINTAGDDITQMLVRAPVALHVAFVTSQSVSYPTSLMGTFAAIRQMLLDARRLQETQKIYAANNQRGLRRPESNKSLEALFPVLNNQIPIVLNVNSEREIVRALDLAKEFNLQIIIAGGNEAWKVADRLKAQNVPVLLSLNFPKRSTATSADADPETMETLRLRVEAPKNAARLKQAGVRFAFQSGGATNLADFWINAAKAVENGLSKEDAIRAITLDAAELMGVARQLGSIETGKVANLTVLRGDAFDKSREFTHVFVDGQMFEIKQPTRLDQRKVAVSGSTTAAPQTPTTTTPNISGTWSINVELPGQPLQATLILTQQETKLGGTLQSQFGNSEITNGEVTADSFRFTSTVTIGETFDVVFTGKVSGNQISGTATSPQGTVPFNGTKNP